MKHQTLLFFPTGRSVERCKQDAKSLVKKSKSTNQPVSLNQALDKVASDNGVNHPWTEALKMLETLAPKKPKIAQMHLLGHALNLVIKKNLIDLNSTEEALNGYLECGLLGKPTIINWGYIGYGEIRFSVWWNFDKTKHPQHLDGGFSDKVILDDLSEDEQRRYLRAKKGIWSTASNIETYITSRPLARPAKYKDFIGVVCSTWIERKRGKYLQTVDGEHVHDSYIRSKDKKDLCIIPDCKPKGFSLDGQFHL